ncbi:universal stress protein [Yoonia sediminilitoris]|uniref:Nucleotide-binding universal stress UspA family protein n=1 Tax=Yoonia sediminilitoris TaxID=1286148 RepID=A0A2T6KIZ8_9RHOB|nr:universal stress protein [Yoonia sediminilitoris]PUB15678.1 nucleotide-binding universal stress UspA family protein [Yoonia sediminilitoris]RCW96287.1 nucleotide-binding universal stress UspA family protein [Yoonia sediminilitoris]
MFRTIVVGVDGSECSARSLDLACELAKLHGGEIHLVHSPELVTVRMAFAGEGVVDVPSDDQKLTAGKKVMEQATAAASAKGITPATTTIGEDGPVDDILTIVQLYGADLIVTGRRGLSSVGGLFLGSTSQKLAQSADCPCLTVK